MPAVELAGRIIARAADSPPSRRGTATGRAAPNDPVRSFAHLADASSIRYPRTSQELALHAVDTHVAEASVLRQRTIDWQFRSQPAAHAKVMHKQLFPFVAVERLS